jgi:hypothetical protein
MEHYKRLRHLLGRHVGLVRLASAKRGIRTRRPGREPSSPGDGEACTALGRCVRCGSGARALLATGGDDRTVRLWDPVDGRCVVTVRLIHRRDETVEV